MADVKHSQSEFMKYMADNSECSEQIMRIMTTLYNNPMKISEVQPFLQQMYGIEQYDPAQEDTIRTDNQELQNEIFDL